MQKPTAYQLNSNGRIPNNPSLPLLVYPQAFQQHENLELQFEERFQQHHWGGNWVNGVYDYHHYHSKAHEVLGVISGSATLIFGGPGGREITVKAGDMVVIPAGVGHCRTDASNDFTVIGAYPEGQENYDICTQDDDPDEKLQNIQQLALPQADPITGKNGPLMEIWHKG